MADEKTIINPFSEPDQKQIELTQKSLDEFYADEQKRITGDIEVQPELVTEVKNSDPNDPENKHYLLLAVFIDEEEDVNWWGVFKGRTAVYEYIKNNIENLDVDESQILVDNVKLQDRVSVYKFVTYISSMNFYNDNFDIEQYHYENSDDDSESDTTIVEGENNYSSSYNPLTDPNNMDSVDL